MVIKWFITGFNELVVLVISTLRFIIFECCHVQKSRLAFKSRKKWFFFLHLCIIIGDVIWIVNLFYKWTYFYEMQYCKLWSIYTKKAIDRYFRHSVKDLLLTLSFFLLYQIQVDFCYEKKIQCNRYSKVLWLINKKKAILDYNYLL